MDIDEAEETGDTFKVSGIPLFVAALNGEAVEALGSVVGANKDTLVGWVTSVVEAVDSGGLSA